MTLTLIKQKHHPIYHFIVTQRKMKVDAVENFKESVSNSINICAWQDPMQLGIKLLVKDQ